MLIVRELLVQLLIEFDAVPQCLLSEEREGKFSRRRLCEGTVEEEFV